MYHNVMHHTNTSLVGSGCEDVHRGSSRFVGVLKMWPPRSAAKRFSTSLAFISRPSKCTRWYTDLVGRLLVLYHLRRSSRGLAIDPHIRRWGLRRAHGRPRHRQLPCGVALHVALLRLPRAPIPMLVPQLRRNVRIERRGDTTAPSGLCGELLLESRHIYTHHSTDP